MDMKKDCRKNWFGWRSDTSDKNNDPVFCRGDQWYFWDETWANSVGPFKSEALARDMLGEYCNYLGGTGYN